MHVWGQGVCMGTLYIFLSISLWTSIILKQQSLNNNLKNPLTSFPTLNSPSVTLKTWKERKKNNNKLVGNWKFGLTGQTGKNNSF